MFVKGFVKIFYLKSLKTADLMKKGTVNVVVIGVIVENNNFLLTKRTSDKPRFDGAWQFAGGGLEFGESPEETVVRELKEELGIQVKVKRLLNKVFSKTFGSWHGVFIVYECQRVNKKQKIRLNPEASDFGWFAKSEIENLKVMPLTKEIVALFNKIV